MIVNVIIMVRFIIFIILRFKKKGKFLFFGWVMWKRSNLCGFIKNRFGFLINFDFKYYFNRIIF